jgi:hypothetical protein
MTEKAEQVPTEAKKSAKTKNILNDLLSPSLTDNDKLNQGLSNLNSLPAFDTPPPSVNGKEFSEGVMGFRKAGRSGLSVAIACGKAQVRYIPLPKFIAMVENLDDPESATIMLQNFQSQEEYKSARGQILARINPESSAITIIQGVSGRIVRGPQDIALFDVYYIDRSDMTAFYLAAKAQVSNEDTLETMIQTYDGWKAFDVPLDPLNPYDN